MPCYDAESAMDREEERKKIAEYEKIKSLLCSTCRILQQKGYDFAQNPALHEWWYEHQIEDKKKTEAKIISSINRERQVPLTNEQIKLMKIYGII